MVNNLTFTQYTIDKATPIPLYFQLKHILLEMINKSELNPGEMIPTEFELCKIFDISRTTVRQALSELVNEGIFYRVKGRGTFVAQDKIIQDVINEKEAYTNEKFNRISGASCKVLEYNIVAAPSTIAATLKIPINHDVISLKKLICIDHQPILISHTYIPHSICKNADISDINEETLYQILSDNINTNIYRVVHNVEATIPTKEDCELLSISKSIAIQLVHSIGFNNFEVPVEYTLCRYRGDKHLFTVETIKD